MKARIISNCLASFLDPFVRKCFIVAAFSIALLFVSANFSELYSQKNKGNELLDIPSWVPPCKPDCEEDDWIEQEPITCNIGTCSYRVSYFYRIACGFDCDIFIGQVWSFDGPPCDNAPIVPLLDDIIICIIQKMINDGEPEWCVPSDPGSFVNYRVTRGSCWLWFDHPSPHLLACNNSKCCTISYTISMDQQGVITITRNGVIFHEPCPQEPQYLDCEPVCSED